MTAEPIQEEINDDDQAPATKGDMRRSQEELAAMMASSFEDVATKDDLKRFATKDDLTGVRTELKDEIKSVRSELKGDIQALEQRMDGKLATMLSIIQSIDERLKDWRDIPERLAKVEEEVADLSWRR